MTLYIIDCQGMPLIPGLNDAHCHIFSTASSFSGLDCGSKTVVSVPELLLKIGGKAHELPPGSWIRGFGMDPDAYVEARYPTRRELDSVAPDHLLRMEHSSGHASLLNTRGLDAAGIGPDTPDPIGGVIERDPFTGEPTGLLLEMGDFLREKLGHTRSSADFERDVSSLAETLLSYGVTSVQDAGPHNGISQWETFASIKRNQAFGPRITMMAGAGKVNDFIQAGLGWNSGDKYLRVGHAKIMLGMTTGSLYPGRRRLGTTGAEGSGRWLSVCHTRYRTGGPGRCPGSAPTHPAAFSRLWECLYLGVMDGAAQEPP